MDPARRAGRRRLAGTFVLAALIMSQAWAPPARASVVVGACCLQGSPCDEIDPFSCDQRNGTFMGSGTVCANVDCPSGVAAPVLSIFGLVGMIGGLAGFGAYRIFFRKRG